MSLSYNRLTGTIPMLWFNHKLELLDLSYNKLIGSLPETSEEFNNTKWDISLTISLEVNRLSGIIPSDVTSFPGNINILKGNILSCNFFKQELPKNDPDYDSYVCGSNMVNNSVYLWIIVGISLSSFAIGIIGIRRIRNNHLKKRFDSLRWFGEVTYRIYKTLLIENSSDLPEVMVISSSRYPFTFDFFSFTLHTRQYAVLVLTFILVVLLPVYGVLGAYYRTYEERYAWTISAAFLSVHWLFRKAVKEYYNHHFYCVIKSCKNWRVIVLWTIAWLINGTIMITADSLYVSLIINRSTKYEYLIQMTLALFKLLWHDIGIFQMIYQLKKIFTPTTHTTTINREEWRPLHSIDENSNDDTTLTHPMLLLPHQNEEEEEEEEREIVESISPSSFLPLGWGEVSGDQASFRRQVKTNILHRKQLLTLRISYTFAVMFVFGSLFPPLALIAAIAIINITMLEEYLTKVMLTQACCQLNSDDESVSSFYDVKNYLEKECKDIEWNMFKVMKLIVYLTCGLLGFVLFDVCGDRNGWSEGMIPMVLMILFPFILYPITALITKKKLMKRDWSSRDGM
eukprot:gene3037-3230_t